MEAIASWALLGYGCLDGRRWEAAILEQQRCQWSAEKAGVTSALRLHDATNAYLSTKHDVANRQQIRWHSKRWTRNLFDQRIPVAIGTITDEEGLIDLLARSGKWP